MSDDRPGEQSVTFSRRAFVGSAAAGAASFGFLPLLRSLPASTVAAAFAQRSELRWLTEHQAAVVVEATARLIPGPSDVEGETTGGAREAGVVNYIDLMLGAYMEDPPRIFAGGPFSDRHGGASNDMATFVPLAPWEDELWRSRIDQIGEWYIVGIDGLDEAAGGDFSAVTPERMDEILAADIVLPEELQPPSGFRRVLFEHAVEGTYAVPEYGGNAGLVGWSGIGYAGDVAPEGWTGTEITESDGPDPVPGDFELPFPSTIVADSAGSAVDVEADGAAFGDLGGPATVLGAALPGLARWRTKQVRR